MSAAAVLVGYATRTGSTQEVAEAVSATIRGNGIEVDLQPIRNVRTLNGYRMLVLGAPLYMFHWHKDAMSFLSKYKNELGKLPVAVFALGPLNDVEKDWEGAHEQLDNELTKFPGFAPFACEVFGGKFDPAKLRFPMTLIPAMKSMPASDIRRWDAIRAWASNLSSKL